PAGPAASVTRESEALELVERVRARGGTVVATGGCFDLLHAGHVESLRAARELGDALVVCLNSDDSVRRLKGPERPIIRADDRAAVLGALACVDAVAVFEEDTPVALLERLRPDLFVKGGDYRPDELPETPVLARWGGRVVTVPLKAGRSTTSILQEVRRVA
ncbi:D-glycero-beta-D-manno-heptose 1-phosphate adenylyltransferase, partial [Patulibacter sp. S7RM1-6]